MLNTVCKVCSYTCKCATQLATHSSSTVRDVAATMCTSLYSHPMRANPVTTYMSSAPAGVPSPKPSQQLHIVGRFQRRARSTALPVISVHALPLPSALYRPSFVRRQCRRFALYLPRAAHWLSP